VSAETTHSEAFLPYAGAYEANQGQIYWAWYPWLAFNSADVA
jgi:hypothetical protein